MREVPEAERPRERLAQRGPGGLSAAELIALVWGTGARGMNAVDLAEEALARHDGLTGLARASDTELAGIPGIGPARAAQLSAAFELGRRLLADWPTGRWTIRAPRDVAERLILQMGRLEREELRVVLLNTKNAVLRVSTVYQGNVSSSLVRVGELYRDAVRLNASGIILVHNHPSGDPTPSPDDLHLTAEALAAGRLLDIELLDHLVIGHDAFVSLRERGVAFGRSTRPAVGFSGSGRAAPVRVRPRASGRASSGRRLGRTKRGNRGPDSSIRLEARVIRSPLADESGKPLPRQPSRRLVDGVLSSWGDAAGSDGLPGPSRDSSVRDRRLLPRGRHCASLSRPVISRRSTSASATPADQPERCGVPPVVDHQRPARRSLEPMLVTDRGEGT